MKRKFKTWIIKSYEILLEEQPRMQRPIQIHALIKQKQNPRQKQIKKKLLQPDIKLKVNNKTSTRSEPTKKKNHIQHFKTTPCFPPKCTRNTKAARERNAYAWRKSSTENDTDANKHRRIEQKATHIEICTIDLCTATSAGYSANAVRLNEGLRNYEG